MVHFSIDRQHIERYSELELLAKQVVEGFITGLHKSPFHGFSVEFAEHRLYNSGESIRHIDWKLYGRTDKLFVKRYEEETNLRCRVIMDISSSMFYPPQKKIKLEEPNKISFATLSAAAIINILKKQRDAVGLSCFAEKLDVHTDVKSNSAHINYLYDILEQQVNNSPESGNRTNVAQILHQLAGTIHKRSLIILFSDLFDPSLEMDAFFDALRHLKHFKHEVIIFQLTDKKKELQFDFDFKPKRFIDLETGETIKLHPNEVKDEFIKQMEEFQKVVQLKCTQYGIEFIEVDISKGFDQILYPFFSKRKKMQ
jgi:uncharacterized protein (DUF58 family)